MTPTTAKDRLSFRDYTALCTERERQLYDEYQHRLKPLPPIDRDGTCNGCHRPEAQYMDTETELWYCDAICAYDHVVSKEGPVDDE